MSAEALLAAGYAAFLLLAAAGLDLLARHSHRRTGRYRTAGFTFQPDLDVWECPEGEHLHRVETDHASAARPLPRAAPQSATPCPAKARCTDSDEGREIAQRARPLAAFGGRALPPRHLRRPGRPRGGDRGDSPSSAATG